MTAGSELEFLKGGGEMGALMRSTDWSTTPLGPPHTWPQSLRTTVSLCLSSTFPILIAWGPERIQIYNDTYRPICGEKHPQSMGQAFNECWASALPAVGHVVDRAQAGQGSYIENLRMFLDRYGYLEEAFMTFSFSPIRDESGGVGGLFHPITETTDRMLGARRTLALRELAAQLAEAKSLAEIGARMSACYETVQLDLPFVLLYELAPDADHAELVASAGLQAGSPGAPITLALADTRSWPLAEALQASQVVSDVVERFGALPIACYAEPPRSAVLLPVQCAGEARPSAFLVAGVSARRALDPAYHAFYEQLQSSVVTSLSNARAYAQEQARVAALAELDRAKTAFFSNVSHEFRTPLTLILSPVADGLDDREQPLPPRQRERQEAVHRNALRLLKLVNTLLDFSRIESDRMRAHFAPSDLSALSTDLASAFRSLVEKAGLSLVVDCPPLSKPVWVDREMYEKIVLNLISNAFKFTFAGAITVRVREHGEYAELSVQDSGTGIEASELPHLFERFHRVEGAKGRSYEGSGIGLALVDELIKLHGGTIRVESEPGRGSCFFVRLPFAHAVSEALDRPAPGSTALGVTPFLDEAASWLSDAALPSAHDDDALPSSPLRGRILLVDDNADMRAYVSRLLSNQGLSVTLAENGESALELVRSARFDLVLSDVMMPGLDGFALLRTLRAEPRSATLPVILLSARAGEAAAIEGLEQGADDYLVKPFSGKELISRVQSRLELGRARAAADALTDELRTASLRKDEFLAMLAHELRNPLAAISFALFMLEREQDPNELAMFTETARRQVKHLVRLVDDLLDVSRITRGKVELRREASDLASILDGALASTRAAIAAREHTLDVQREPARYPLLCDPTRIEQVIVNLLLNAAKYTSPRGRLQLSLRRDDHGPVAYAELDVEDNGSGIAADMLNTVFDPFVQVQPSIDRNSGGLGIGLTLVRTLVELHGGTVSAHSKGLGHGSRFRVRLPLASADTVSLPRTPVHVSAATRRIALVEDSDDQRELLKRYLERLGHSVITASDGLEGVDTLLDHAPDVALIDLGLPGCDGFEVARRVRADARGEALYLVALSGYGDPESKQRALAAGFDAHVTKPVDLDVLPALLAARR